MTHGTKCNCIMCTMGKKVGMIKSENMPKTCSACGRKKGEKGEEGTCTCG